MNRSLIVPLILFLATAFTANGCGEPPEKEPLPAGEGISIQNAWARPAGEDRMGAAYFLITNHESSPDTLLSVSSQVANLTEVHESYEQEGGMVGMREAGEVVIPANSSVHLEPGGLHVMLIRLTRNLPADDSFDLILRFAGEGEITVPVPVVQP